MSVHASSATREGNATVGIYCRLGPSIGARLQFSFFPFRAISHRIRNMSWGSDIVQEVFLQPLMPGYRGILFYWCSALLLPKNFGHTTRSAKDAC